MIHSRRSFLRNASRSLAGGAFLLLLPERMLRAASHSGTYLERAVYAMGTTVSISAFGEERTHLLDATDHAFAELYKLERLLSVYRPESDIGRLNAAAGTGPIAVEPDTWAVLSRAKEFHRMSGGAFDVTIEPLMERWGFRGDVHDHRGPAEIPVIGDRYLRLFPERTALLERSGMKVDTGGIAVGYAVDRMASILRDKGIVRALINHGGDLYALGAPEDGEGWQVVIPNPLEPDENLMELSLADRALSTSSNVSTTRKLDGRTVGHIFDPRTRSNPESCLSMTVLASTSCAADAMSTAMFISGDTSSVAQLGYDHIVLRPGERVDTTLR